VETSDAAAIERTRLTGPWS